MTGTRAEHDSTDRSLDLTEPGIEHHYDADFNSDERIQAAAEQSRRYIVAIILLQSGFLAVLLSRSWFLSDDLENFGLAQDQGLSLAYLRLDVFGHFAPMHRFLDWAVFQYAPLNWLAPTVVLIAMLAATSLLLHCIVRVLAPTQSWPTLLVVLFAFSPAVSATAIWWAAAAHSVPAMLCVSLAMLAALRYRRTRRWTDASVYGLALAVGLLCYEKVALAPLAIATLLWATHERRGLRAMLQLARRCTVLIGTSAVLVGLWAIEIKRGHYNQGVPSPSLETWWQWFTRMITQGPAATAAGVNYNAYDGTLRGLLLLLAGAAAVAVVIVSVVRFRGAWRAWVFFALAFFPGIFLTAYGRAASFGPGIASDPHYLTEIAPFLVLALAVAFTRPRRALTRASVKTTRHRAVLVGLVLVPVVAVSVISAFRAVDDFGGASNRVYFDNIQRSADALGVADDPGRYTVLNGDVPDRIVPTAFAPYNTVSEMLPLVPAFRGQSFVIEGKPLLMVLPDGTVQPARLRTIASLAPLAGASCLSPTSVRVPASDIRGDDRTSLFAVIEGVPTPATVTISKNGSEAVIREMGPYAADQIVQGSTTGHPVRLFAIGESELTITPSPGSCVSQFTLLAPEAAGTPSPS
jgi:hypothetical protein